MTLKINNKPYTTEEEAMPLLWFLRDVLRMTGTKYGCGLGICGACMVLVDGQPERACLLTTKDCNDKEVFTVESFPEDGSHPIQQAWTELNVPQCGYCQSGQMISAKALLDKNPNPTETEIKEAMSENICRCGTYPRIIKAIQKIADN